MTTTARLAAIDVRGLNQLGCVNARLIYTVTDVDSAIRWGESLYQEIQRLPAPISLVKWAPDETYGQA
jgi:hypothetical protein